MGLVPRLCTITDRISQADGSPVEAENVSFRVVSSHKWAVVVTAGGAMLSSQGISPVSIGEGRWTIRLLPPWEFITPDCYYEIYTGTTMLGRTISFEYSDKPLRLTDILFMPSDLGPFDLTRAASKLHFLTVRIEADEFKGTGFIFDNDKSGGGSYIVTNRHNVKLRQTCSLSFTRRSRGTPDIGTYDTLKLEYADDHWHYHQDPDVDIAVMPLQYALDLLSQRTGDTNYYYTTVKESSCPGEDQIYDIDTISDVIFVGYPEGIYDAVNYFPIIRHGHFATPYQIPFMGLPRFIIDASVFPGSSGSPVFIPSASLRRPHVPLSQVDYAFVGVLSRWYSATEATGLGRVVKEPRDLGTVVKPSLIMEAIDNMKGSGK